MKAWPFDMLGLPFGCLERPFRLAPLPLRALLLASWFAVGRFCSLLTALLLIAMPVFACSLGRWFCLFLVFLLGRLLLCGRFGRSLLPHDVPCLS